MKQLKHVFFIYLHKFFFMFRKLSGYIKDFFTFNKSERRGLLVLCILILLLIIFNIILPYLKTQEKYDYNHFDKEVAEFLKTREIISTRPKTYRQKDPFNIFDVNASAVEQKLNPFVFDPNTLPYDGFIEMGLSTKQAVTISKYRTKGGKFFKKEDFKKIYGITDKEYETLEPFIEIKAASKKFKDDSLNKENKFSKDEKKLRIDLNTATEEELKKIRGIGNYFAIQIIKFRNRLGGYRAKEQLLEVPKMDSARYVEISPFVEVNARAVRRININTATFDELKEHPYIGYNIALSLINYRMVHGQYVQVSDIKNSALINDANYQKISYYLCTQ